MSELPDNSVALIFTSPPYFAGMEYEQGYSIDDHWDNIEAVMAECARVIMPGGTIALNLNDILNFKGKKGTNKKAHLELTGHFYQKFLKKHGVILENQIVWSKGPDAFSTDRSRAYGKDTKHGEYKIINRHEFIYIFRKDGERKIPSERANLESFLTKEDWAKYIPSVWEIRQVWKSEGHPNVFPDELPLRVIKMFSFVGETVLDPFLGSGSTVKIAKELGRDAVGYERDLRYKETIMEKLLDKKHSKQAETPLLPYFPALNSEVIAQNPETKAALHHHSQGLEKMGEIPTKEDVIETGSKSEATTPCPKNIFGGLE